MILLANEIAAEINVKFPSSLMKLFSDWDVTFLQTAII